MIRKRTAVIGGGAAGMFAAGKLSHAGVEVTLFERNALLGKKLGITGKGRCNVTNDCTFPEFMNAITSNGKFLYSAYGRFTSQDTMAFFESIGVPLKTERGNRVFPVSDKATDIVLALKKYLLDGKTRIVNERVMKLSEKGGKISEVITENGTYGGFDSVVLCTGGMSYFATGSTGDGYALASALGHKITPLTPALVGIESEDKLCRDCQG
ncbi:MAG: aminoacetone oxidase family FAD-binding enzyme, partial [Clostridiales bacterium]|nr:aminoacetone oxidase family FAD-binding enzyme [Clostridiales bacterium]